MQIWLQAIGCTAPGLASWEDARKILRGEVDYAAAPLPPYQPQMLPPNERRRAAPGVRQAFRAAEDALRSRDDVSPGRCAAVLASSDADLSVIDRIARALATPERIVSPTVFHNSVHNAAAGYWSIATDGRLPSSTICAYDASFAVGLIEAALLTLTENCHTLLISSDVPVPEPLTAKRPVTTAASVALLIGPERLRAGDCRLDIQTGISEFEITQLADSQLEALRQNNPTARALPLLRQLALQAHGTVWLEDAVGNGVKIDVTPA